MLHDNAKAALDALPAQDRERLGARLCFRLGFHGDAKLLHHGHEVPVGPLFSDLSAFDAEDRRAGDRGFAVGGLHAEELARMRAGNGPVDDDFVAFGDGVVDCELAVGEAVSAGGDVMLEVVGSSLKRGKD